MPSVTHRKTDVAQRNQSPVSRRIGWLLMLLCLLGSGLCFWQLPSGEFSADSPTVLQAAPEPEPRTRLLTRKIQDIRPGMRVLADNPELAGQTVMPLEIQPENWRLVTLEMPKADGEILTVELLRPAEEFYLAANADEVSETTPLPSLADLVLLMEPTLEVPIRLCQSACALPGALSELASFKNRLENGEPLFRVDDQDLLGRTLHLNLPEMGAVGPATIKEVSPCPAVEEGMGRIVTGRFIHKAANVIDLKITGVEEPIGTTDTHPFWSEDRQTFVPAGELRIGEELRTLTGEKTFVLAKSPRGPPEDVFNIEVEGEHVYNIADSGVLVHNGCDDLAKRGEDLYVGTYNSVRGGNKSSGLNSTHTPHHAVQNAVSPTTHGKGITINMRKDLHELTRTFKKPVDGSIKSLRDHLAADIHDLRKILGNAGYDRSVVNRQLKELIRQNKELWSSLGLGGQ